MGLHFGGMAAVPSWMCLVADAWESDMRPWLERRCGEMGLSRGVHSAYEAYPR